MLFTCTLSLLTNVTLAIAINLAGTVLSSIIPLFDYLPNPVTMASSPDINVLVFEPHRHDKLLSEFVDIYASCITNSNTIANFVLPLNLAAMAEWWTERFAEVRSQKRVIVLAFDNSNPELTAREKLVGYVMLNNISTQTEPFRVSVEKLLVDPAARRLGIATKLMHRAESEAIERGLWLCVSLLSRFVLLT